MGATILVVDDSRVDRQLIAGLLKSQEDWRLEFASDGEEALERIADSAPSIVVTDLVMPHMDGLDLVRAMRAHYPIVPVILMTAHGNEDIAAEALEEGAASYVPKSQLSDRLTETISRVLARSEANRRRKRIATRLHETSCKYRLDNDPSLIGPLLDEFQRTMAAMQIGDATERVRICLAVEEALLNAMYHGNLEITKADSNSAKLDSARDAPVEHVEQGRDRPELQDREVTVSARFTKQMARFVVRDEGRGFRLQNMLTNRLGDYFAAGKSRGLMLLYSIMDEVRFNDRGNEVVFLKTCQQQVPTLRTSSKQLNHASASAEPES